MDLLRVRRAEHVELRVGPRRVLIRDQASLHQANLRLPTGYSFEEFIESLNRRIFFWPGSSRGPISHGIRHFECYQKERPAFLTSTSIGKSESYPTSHAYRLLAHRRCATSP